MTVKELIEELQKYSNNWQVNIREDSEYAYKNVSVSAHEDVVYIEGIY